MHRCVYVWMVHLMLQLHATNSACVKSVTAFKIGIKECEMYFVAVLFLNYDLLIRKLIDKVRRIK